MSTAGTQANGGSTSPTIGASGRHVAFVSAASNLVDGDTNGVADVFVRDRDTDGDGILDEPGAVLTRRVNVSALGAQADAPAIAARMSGTNIAFQSAATTLVPGLSPGVQRIFVVDLLGTNVHLASVSTTGAPADQDCDEFDINSNGPNYVVVFRSDAALVPGDIGTGGAIYARLSAESRTVRLSFPLHADPGGSQPRVTSPTLDVRAGTPGNGDPGYAGFAVVRTGATKTGRVYRCLPDGTQLEDVGEGVRIDLGPATHFTVTVREDPARLVSTHLRRSAFGRDSEPVLENISGASSMPVLSPDGRSWLAFRAGVSFVLDFLSAERTDVPFASGDWRGDSIAFSAPDAFYVTGDTNQVHDVFVADLRRLFDSDGDTLDDRWERVSGLDSQDGTGVNGPNGDPDGDGIVNVAEWYNGETFWLNDASTHPTGATTRYLAEGIVNGFFDTQLHLVNPSASAWASVQIRYQGLSPLLQPLLIPPRQHRTVSPGAESLNGDFAIAVESNVPVVVDRRVTWDRTAGQGAHLETAMPEPAADWYLTEGTTVEGFELFYLLQNPGTEFATATVRYLRPSGAPIVRTYHLAPRSRTTIRVNGVDPALDDSDVSAHITGTRPLIAERAMYATRHDELFSLGAAAAGVTAPAASWFLAEGATGSFFDLYVLIANPQAAPAAVTARFLKGDGSVVTRQYAIAANSRFSIFVDGIPGLESTPVSTEITSTNGVPVVVERAMYWPGGFFDYYEGHASAGVTAPARRWAIAHGEDGGPREAQTYVLVANPSATAGLVRVTLLPEVSPFILPPPPIPQIPPIVVSLPATSRVTLRVGQDAPSPRFGVLVESIGDAPAPIVVESACYWTVNGRLWGAGGALVGTPLP